MQLNNPLLTVIMPVFNTAPYVAKAIESVLAQTHLDFELLIVDDGSTDNSSAVARGFQDSRIRVFANESNAGKVAVCNDALNHSRGKYVTVHDSDDYSSPDRFQQQISFLEAHPEFGMCGTWFYEIDESGSVIREIDLESDPDRLRVLIRSDSQFHGPTMIFRRDILEQIGGLYRDFHNKEDVDLSMRIAEKYPVKNLAQHLYYYRLLPQGITKRNFDFMRFEGLRVLQLLAEQRRLTGQDCLMRGDLVAYGELLNQIKQPYVDDPSLLYRNGTSLNVYFRFWQNAFWYASKAIIANPWKFVNYREFLYVTRTYLLSTLRGVQRS